MHNGLDVVVNVFPDFLGHGYFAEIDFVGWGIVDQVS